MNAACFVPMILASNKRAEEERAEQAKRDEAARVQHTPAPKTDAAPSRVGRVDRRG